MSNNNYSDLQFSNGSNPPKPQVMDKLRVLTKKKSNRDGFWSSGPDDSVPSWSLVGHEDGQPPTAAIPAEYLDPVIVLACVTVDLPK